MDIKIINWHIIDYYFTTVYRVIIATFSMKILTAKPSIFMISMIIMTYEPASP